jgi:large subunit ribosomal protein L6
MPIEIPSGIKVKVDKRSVVVQKGSDSLAHALPRGIDCSVTDKEVTFTRETDDRRLRSLHGLTRALVANAVKGMHEGFKIDLEIVGIGYKAQVQGNILNLALGYSHPIEYRIPDGIDIKVEKLVRLSVTGIDRQKVGQVAAEIRRFRPPEPYKGKGIKYAGERIKRKAGKAGKTGAA